MRKKYKMISFVMPADKEKQLNKLIRLYAAVKDTTQTEVLISALEKEIFEDKKFMKFIKDSEIGIIADNYKKNKRTGYKK